MVEMSVDKISRDAQWTAIHNHYGEASVHARKCYKYHTALDRKKRFFFGLEPNLGVGDWIRGEKMLFHAYVRHEQCGDKHWNNYIMHVKRPGKDWAYLGSENTRLKKNM